MFTGIIQKLGRVQSIEASKLALESDFTDLELGESVAVNGVCLTVAEIHSTGALFMLSPETLTRTSLSQLKAGSSVNLERAVTLNTRLSGHLVQGHVDGMGTLLEIKAEADCFHLVIKIPRDLSKYCVEKGSITIDGISLTINALTDETIDLMIIPHTWRATQLSTLHVGDHVNLEVDVLAKYVERLLCRNSN